MVIFIDEIDAVRSLPFSTDEFFAAIRECYNRRTEDPEFERLTFCLLGVATPSDLIRDTRHHPVQHRPPHRADRLHRSGGGAAGPGAGGSERPHSDVLTRKRERSENAKKNMYGTGQRQAGGTHGAPSSFPFALSLLSRFRVNNVGESLGTSQSSAALLARVLYWTGGHPYLTQRLCQAVAQDTVSSTPPGWIGNVRRCSSRRRPGSETLTSCLCERGLLRGEADLASLLDLYEECEPGKRVPADNTNPLVICCDCRGLCAR